MGGSIQTLIVESVVIATFILVSLLSFRFNLWWVVVGLFTHGIFDAVHGYLISNPGVPVWWPMFCLTYDLTAAGYLAWLLSGHRLTAPARPQPT
jgi:hypothetical protein